MLIIGEFLILIFFKIVHRMFRGTGSVFFFRVLEGGQG